MSLEFKKFIYALINNFVSLFKYKLIKSSDYENLLEKVNNKYAFELITKINPSCINDFVQNIQFSKSQLAQDLFVLSELDFKKKGFFVEFGATDGVELSNTFLLESNFLWEGILAEPAKQWHKQLKKNRKVFIENNAVWRSSDEILDFVEADVLSTIDQFTNLDMHAESREKSQKYRVKTISLEDLLNKYNAPKIIDYLSIDTEGSEFEILSAFDFDKYKFKVITCEHNYTINREKIFRLLTEKGYQRKNMDISKFDDWYVLK